MLPAAVPIGQHYVTQALNGLADISKQVRVRSDTLTTACRQRGLPMELAEVCAGLLATVCDDLIAVGSMSPKDFERSKRLERILAACDEPAASALRLAVAASPVNGRAAVRHWDAVCDKPEVGLMAWCIGLDTDTARMYGRRRQKLEEQGR